MPSITRRPSHGPEHRAAAEAQVFAAVERLLDEGMNYTEISVQRIISEAKIARSTFYAHFRDKSDLLSRLAEATRENFFNAASAWEAMGAAAGVPSLAQIFGELIAKHREHSALPTTR
jgi:AcrR family transcriptional regulator